MSGRSSFSTVYLASSLSRPPSSVTRWRATATWFRFALSGWFKRIPKLKASCYRSSATRSIAQPSEVEGFIKWIKRLQWSDGRVLEITCRTLGVDESTFLNDIQPYMTIDQLTQLASDGFTLGGHGRVHVQLGQVQQPELEAEIVESCRIIREISKADRVPFAFPFSGSGVDRRLLCDIMARNPFISLLFDTQDFAKDEWFIVNRVGADEPSRLGPSVGTAASVVRHGCIKEIQSRFGVT